MENRTNSFYKAEGKKSSIGENAFYYHSLSTFVKAFLAGVMVALGATTFLSVSSKYLGSALFSIGLFVIFSYGLALYTGKIGYFIVQNKNKNMQLIPTWLGNLAGTVVMGYILRLTRASSKLSSRALSLCEEKLNDNVLSIFVLALFCGMLMFIAADNYKNAANSIQKYLGIILPVMAFILCGFEHCVANMYYFSVSNSWSLKAVLYILVMTLGNSLGAMIIPASHKLTELIRSKIR